MSLLSILEEYGRDVSYMSTDSPTGKSSHSMNDGFPVDPFILPPPSHICSLAPSMGENGRIASHMTLKNSSNLR